MSETEKDADRTEQLLNKTIEVDPPAARICEDCGNVDKVTELEVISFGETRCSECGSSRTRTDSWERVQE